MTTATGPQPRSCFQRNTERGRNIEERIPTMRITPRLLAGRSACGSQLREFTRLYPDGVEPTVEVLTELASRDLDVLWLARLLPIEGPGSSRSFALWCAQQVAHLCTDSRVSACLGVIARRVADPASISDADLASHR
mgnify:CR=1 FL=1